MSELDDLDTMFPHTRNRRGCHRRLGKKTEALLRANRAERRRNWAKRNPEKIRQYNQAQKARRKAGAGFPATDPNGSPA